MEEGLGLRTSRDDLRAVAMPMDIATEWQNPEVLIDILYQRAEHRACQISDWYLRDKKTKKRTSQSLRIFAILCGTMGAIVPYLPGRALDLHWGYLLIALAGAAVAMDKLFGYSSAWMRDVVAAQAVQEKLDELQCDWARIRSACGADATEAIKRLQRFGGELSRILRDETYEWREEFHGNVDRLSEMVSSDRSTGPSS
jgi:hypothetical protein